MTQKQKDLFATYAGIMTQIRELETIRDAMKEDILNQVEKTEEGKVVTEDGTFAKTPVVSWTYSDAVKELEDKLKIKKTREQEKGIAEKSVKFTIRFTTKSV